MRIKVTKLLNTRVGGAHTTYQTGAVREPGDEIEVTGTVQGEELDGNNTWYKVGDDANKCTSVTGNVYCHSNNNITFNSFF